MVASVGASATFIGLLFVALTVVIQRSETPDLIPKKYKVFAGSSYIALITIFFISLTSLLPSGNVRMVLLVMGILGTISSIRLLSRGEKVREKEILSLLSYGSILVYAFIAIYGIFLISKPEAIINADIIYVVMLILYIVALERAWALIGIDNK
jgi:hypothetical protein